MWSKLLCEEKKVKFSREDKTDNDYRSIFEKDYHRSILSPSFRRLQDKAQVFPLEKMDFVRTRLTHSIEVASVARSLGKNLVDFIKEKDNSNCKNIQYIPNILECAGILHDLGNPPFGHFGEDAIRDWFIRNLNLIIFDGKTWKYKNELQGTNIKYRSLVEILPEQKRNDFIFFEGNAQTIRNVMKLNYLIDENGLNLSYPLLNTLIKYPVNSLNINKTNLLSKKMGIFAAEELDFKKIILYTDVVINNRICRHPLTYLLEAADDITYLTDDLEDAFNKDKIRVIDIINELEKIKGEDKLLVKTKMKIEKYKDDADLHNFKNVDMYVIQRLKVFLQGSLISVVVDSFIKNYQKIMSGNFEKTLLEESEGRNIEICLRNIASRFIFNSKDIIENEVKGHKVVEGILDELTLPILNLDSYNKTKTYSEKLYHLLSDSYCLIFENKLRQLENEFGNKPEEKLQEITYNKLLLITDFICGMTDSFAYDYYQKIFSIR